MRSSRICRVGICAAVLVLGVTYSNYFLSIVPIQFDIYNGNSSMEKVQTRFKPLDKNKTKIVIILAYMHTGSTYTGALIQNHPGTYYEYESLRSLQMSTRRYQQIRYINQSPRQPPLPERHHNVNDELAASLVYNIATCKHDRLDVSTLGNFFFGVSNEINRDWRPYITCFASGRQYYQKPHSNLLPLSAIEDKDITRCLHHVREKCESARVRVTKYIRLTMSAAYTALRDLDNVRIIHLVRDPRAMMDSQLRKNDMNVNSFQHFVERTKEMCQHMRADLQLATEIEAEFPDLIYPLRYEDMVSDPLKIAKEIFDFIDEEFLETDKSFVIERSIESDTNSTVRESVWRQHIPAEHLKVVDEHCNDLYDKLGYISLNSLEAIRDTNVKSYFYTRRP